MYQSIPVDSALLFLLHNSQLLKSQARTKAPEGGGEKPEKENRKKERKKQRPCFDAKNKEEQERKRRKGKEEEQEQQREIDFEAKFQARAKQSCQQPYIDGALEFCFSSIFFYKSFFIIIIFDSFDTALPSIQ